MRQFAEGLSDAQAADGVRARIDWKYALALELTDPSYDTSILSEFRQRLLDGKAELLLFETMLTLFRERRLINAKGHQRTASTHVLAAQMGTDGRQLRCTIDEPAPPLAAGDPRHPAPAAGMAAAVLGDPREPTSALAPRG
jgi:hypothetical protein